MEDRWNRLWSIFHALRETPSEQREDALTKLSAGDPSLRDEVRELLKADAAGMNPLDVIPASARGMVSAPSTGEMVGRYKLVSMLGQGGMGVVYAAEQEEPVHRKAAVKILRSEFSGPREHARFEAEHQALAMLSHPNIAQVYDGGTANGHLFIAMEYVEGSVLTAACDQQKLGIRERVRLFAQVCEAIQHAHQRGIIHRDLKPSNVLLAGSGEKAIPKVIDFGIAKGVGVRLSAESIQTREGTLLGTPEYMSPEQAMSGPIDTRTDVYALGTMFYELVCGSLPFDFNGVDLMHALWMVSHEDPSSPSARFALLPKAMQETIAANRATTPEELLRQLRGEVDWVAMKAIEKEPTGRYPSASEFAADLERLLGDQPVVAGPLSGSYRLKKYIRRHRAGAAAVAGVAASLVLGIIGTSWMATVASRERDAAEVARDQATREAAVSKATVNFVNDMFSSADPIGSRGGPGSRDVKVVDVLERATKDIDAKFAKEPEVAASLRHTLARTYFGLGLFDRATPLMERAWKDRMTLFGPEHPKTLDAAHDLAACYRRIGETERSGRLIRNTYLARERVLGPDHPDTIASLDDLGVQQTAVGEMKSAEAYFRDAVNRFTRAVGPEDRRTLVAMSNLSYALSNHSQPEEAEKLYRTILSIRKRVLGPGHAETLGTMSNLSATLVSLGKHDEAIGLARESLAAYTQVLGPEHTKTLQARNNVAAMLVRSKKYEEAIPELRAVAEVYERTMGPEHEMTLTLKNNVANTTMRAGHPEEAEAMYRKLIPVADRVFAKKSGDLASFKMGYAVTLARVGKQLQADPILDAAHKQLLETFGPKDPRTKMAEARLRELRTTGAINKTL